MASSAELVIAVFESRPFWGPELLRQFQQSSITVRECRALRDLAALTEDSRSGLFVIDLEDDALKCLGWLSSTWRRLPDRWPVIAIGSAAIADAEWTLREAGVTAYLPDFVSGDEFAKLCRKQLGVR